MKTIALYLSNCRYALLSILSISLLTACTDQINEPHTVSDIKTSDINITHIEPMPPGCGVLATALRFQAITDDKESHKFAIMCPQATLKGELAVGMDCRVRVAPQTSETLLSEWPDLIDHHVVQSLVCDGEDLYDHSFFSDL